MSQVVWKNRLHRDSGSTCKIVVDGTDFQILEPPKTDDSPLPFDRKWFCHKTRRAGVRYEIASCIQTGDIVHVNGPFPCGQFPDSKIFKRRLQRKLQREGEMAVADRGYRGLPECRLPDQYLTRSEKFAQDRARARHETINGRLKTFRCLSDCFRHDVSMHAEFFAVALVCTQLMFEYHGPTFNCRF